MKPGFPIKLKENFLTPTSKNNKRNPQRLSAHDSFCRAVIPKKPNVPTHHMTRPVMTAAQVTQQVSGLLVSSSMSLQQQHMQIRYTVRTSRLTPRPTAATHARSIRD